MLAPGASSSPAEAASHDVGSTLGLQQVSDPDAPMRVEFDGSGFVPEVARVEPGATVLFENAGASPITVEESGGRFSLAPIPVGGGGVVTLSEIGVYPYQDGGSGAEGRILIGPAGFEAPPTDPIADHIPTGWFSEDDVAATHPTLVSDMYVSRILVRFADGVTVAEAEEALSSAGAVPVGGLPSDGIVAALIAGTPDFGALDASLDVLNNHPAVVVASPMIVAVEDVIPPRETGVQYPEPWEWMPTATSDGHPAGGDRNWGAEASRYPQAWNLGNVARATADDVTTVVIDSAFSPEHPDIASVFRLRSVCNGSRCSADDLIPGKANGFHGTAVTSIIGARHERPEGIGLAGVNPAANVTGLMNEPLGIMATLSALVDRVAAERAEPLHLQDAFARVRLVNVSMGYSRNPAKWAATHRDLTCGPGIGDDADPGTNGPCLPWTDDDWLGHMQAEAKLYAPILVRASRLGIMVVNSAGNDGNKWCVGADGRLWGTQEAQVAGMNCSITTPRPSTRANIGFAWAGLMWDKMPETLDSSGVRVPNPVLSAESWGNKFAYSRTRSGYSLVDGTFAAPGWMPVPRLPDARGTIVYDYLPGTSFAAPQVTGLLGYLLALDASLTVTELRDMVATFADISDPAPAKQPAPRIDAFGSVIRVPGALEALLDVDDGTADGNRRVVYGPGGSIRRIDAAFDAAEPIGADRTIDEADFRVYRDAFLDMCLVRTSSTGCNRPLTIGIAIDGGDGHPKRDHNRDGCAPPRPCPTPEYFFSRADFNGDGVSFPFRKNPVEIDGTVQELTDLGVLATRYQPAPAGQGWHAPPGQIENMLADLLTSGDIEVNVAGLRLAGGAGLEVELIDGGASEFVMPIEESADSVTVMVPAGRPVDITLRGSRSGNPVSFSETFQLLAGEDVRYDPCGVLRLSTDADDIPFGGQLELTAQLDPCDDVDVGGIAVDFQAIRDGGGGDATFSASPVATDVDGRASTTFIAGEKPGSYLVTARSSLPTPTGAVEVETTVSVTVNAGYRLETLTTATLGLLGAHPSVSPNGNVYYTARFDPAASFDQIFRANPTHATSEIGSAARALVEPGTTFGTRIETRSGDFFVRGSFLELSSDSTFERSIKYAIGGSPNRPETLATATLEGIRMGPLIDVGVPTANNAGDAIFPVQESGDTVDRLGKRSGGGALFTGPPLNIDWPRYADDGSTVGLARFFPVETTTGGTWITTAIVAGDELLGIEDSAILTPLAVEEAPDALEPTGWTLLGDKPDVSASGDVIVFVGDRGDGPSVYVSVRVGVGTYTEPVAITGPGSSFGPELGTVDGDPRYLVIDESAEEQDLNLGVIQQSVGVDGVEDDEVVVAVFGRPDGPGTGFEGGLFTIPITIGPARTFDRGPARRVIQLGDTFDSDPVERIGWHRVIDDDGGSSDPADHRLAFWVRTANGERIVHAQWVGAPDRAGLSSVSFDASTDETRTRQLDLAYRGSSGGTRKLVLTPGDGSGALQQVAQVSGSSNPVPIPGLVVSDLNPENGALINVVNRSFVAGEPADGTLIVGQDTFRLDPGEQRAIRVDSERSVVTIEAFSIGIEVAASITLGLTAPAGVAPVADAGGPYSLTSGDPVVLDASGSTDDGAVVEAVWDLDNDGFFDDASGITTTVGWPDLASALCGGSCVADATYTIGVRVTDDDGISAEASTTIEVSVVVQDFTLNILPMDQLINPGSTVEYRVEVGSVGGFTEMVDLSVDPLPAGFRASLSPERVRAPGSATLDVSAPQDAQEAPVSVDVTGTSGTIVHSTSSEASVVFGLIPICFEPVTGIVVDKTTQAPLAGVTVEVEYREEGTIFVRRVETTTGADGRFEVLDIPEFEQLAATAERFDGYHERREEQPHRCGDPADFVLQMTPWQFATVRGRVVEALADPTDTSRSRAVFPTDTPVPGATVDITRVPELTADASGSFTTTVLLASPDNGDIEDATIRAEAPPGFWPGLVADLTFSSGPALEVDVPLVAACTVQVGASGRLTDQDGNPIAGRRILLVGSGGPEQLSFGFNVSRIVGEATTDADGRYDIALVDSYLGRNNSAFPFEVSVSSASNVDETFTVDRCGAQEAFEADFELFVPPAIDTVERFGTVSGFVVDAETGEVIEDIRVVPFYDHRFQGPDDRTGIDGSFFLEEVFIGENDVSLRADFEAVVRSADGYYPDRFGPFTVAADRDSYIGTLGLVPVHPAALEGRIVDVVTGEPVHRARVSAFGQARFTDDNGFYRFDGLELPKYNEPTTATVQARRSTEPEYFGDSARVELHPDQTTIQDFELLRQCQNVTIRGVVVNAVTGEPIEGAQVVADRSTTEFTDVDGRFLFEGLTAGGRNRPDTITLTASAQGFLTQSRRVTVYCGATLTVNFGVDTGSGSVLGTVTDTLGEPIRSARVVVETGGSDSTNSAGEYRIDDVPLGVGGGPTDWTVAAIHQDGRRLEQTATVTNGGETAVDFVFQAVVEPDNAPPVVNDIAVSVEAGSSRPVSLSGRDPDFDDLTFEIVDPPAVGALSGEPPAVTYSAPADGTGETTFTYRASDGITASTPGTVTVTILPQSAPAALTPVAALTLTPPNQTAEVSTETCVGATVADGSGTPLGGVRVDFAASGANTASGFAFTDTTGAAGFCYSGTSAGDDTVTAVAGNEQTTVQVHWTAADGANTPPVANDDTFTTDQDTTLVVTAPGVLENDTDADMDALSATLDTDVTSGSLTFEPDGSLEYVPDAGFCGIATFTYTASDGAVPSDPATVTIDVACVAEDEPPIADAGGPYAGIEAAPVVVDGSGSVDDDGIVTYEWDCDGDGTFETTGTVPEATCVYANNGSFTTTVRVTDTAGQRDTATATVTVVNVLPTITADAPVVTIDEGDEATNTGTFSDPADPVTVSASIGTATADTDTWSWSFRSGDGPGESQTVTITASDDTGTSMATFELVVDNVAPSVATPVVAPEPSVQGETAAASAGFTDPGLDDGPFTCVVDYGDGTDPLPGTVGDHVCVGPEHVYEQAGDFTVTVTITDKDGGSGVGQATHRVEPANRPPIADAGPNQTVSWQPGGTHVTLDGSGSFDPDGDPLSYEWTGPFRGGTAPGVSPVVVFDDLGVHVVELTVDDGNGAAATDAMTITVEFTGEFLLIDEDAIDTDAAAIEGISDRAPFCGGPAGGPGDTSVCINDDIADPGVRAWLFTRPRDVAPLTGLSLHSGEIEDEGLFRFGEADPQTSLQNGATFTVAEFFSASGAAADEENLDKIAGVVPLTEADIYALVDRVVCAVVYDSDISIDVSDGYGNLQGATLGVTAFVVTGAAPHPEGDPYLPRITVDVLAPRDVSPVCGAPSFSLDPFLQSSIR